MKVYLDTGVFIDYLSVQGAHGAADLRTGPRNGRSPQQLYADSKLLFERLLASHQSATSGLMLYEIEEALHKIMEGKMKGAASASLLRIALARAIVPAAAFAAEFFQIQLLSLTPNIVKHQLGDEMLLAGGVRAADGLHIMTACAFDADLIVSTDQVVHKLTNKIVNTSGKPMMCIDSDDALKIL